MANGDFGWLQLQLAFMAGRNAVAELDNNPNVPSDSLLAAQCVNEAYLDCYFPQPWSGNPDPKRPGWALRLFSINLQAPVTIAGVGVTQGSNLVTGGFTDAQIGSTISLGSSWYTYAGTDTTGAKRFVENVIEPTGSYAVILYNNATPISAAIGEVQAAPTLLGFGELMPMNSRAEEVRWRSILYGDFAPAAGGGSMAGGSVWPGGINYPVGTPEFYRIENAPFMAQPNPVGATPTPALRALFIVEPMPDRVYNIQVSGYVIPVELSLSTDRPILPGDLCTRVLLPLCREKWATVYKKYTGTNVQGLIHSADGARSILERLNSGQRDQPVRMSNRRC